MQLSEDEASGPSAPPQRGPNDSRPRRPDEKTYLEAWLLVANYRPDEDPSEAISALYTADLNVSVDLGPIPPFLVNAGHWDDVINGQLIPLRNKVRPLLSDICADIGNARRKLRSAADVMLDGVDVKTELWLMGDGRLEHRHTYQPIDDEAGIGLLLALLLDPTRRIGKRLRICPLPNCGRFFLSTQNPKGGQPTKYCRPEHTLAADRLRGPERAARSRGEEKRPQRKKKITRGHK